MFSHNHQYRYNTVSLLQTLFCFLWMMNYHIKFSDVYTRVRELLHFWSNARFPNVCYSERPGTARWINMICQQLNDSDAAQLLMNQNDIVEWLYLFWRHMLTRFTLRTPSFINSAVAADFPIKLHVSLSLLFCKRVCLSFKYMIYCKMNSVYMCYFHSSDDINTCTFCLCVCHDFIKRLTSIWCGF